MKTKILLFAVLFSTMINAQELSVAIEINKTEYSRSYARGNDSMIITCRIKNNSSDTVIFRLADGLDMNYIGEGPDYAGHCFRTYPSIEFSEYLKPDYQRKPESFVKISPGEEIVQNIGFDIAWICRGAPPRGDWKFEIFYKRDITAEDNYLMFQSRYTDTYDKEFKEAWTGKLRSNSVEVVIKGIN